MKRGIIIFYIFFIGLIACKSTNPRTIKTWVAMSDTMFQRLVNEEQPLLDSLCVKRTDSLYRLAYDSIYQKRLVEIRQLLDTTQINVRSR
ncbi:MAG: hypothetical protein SH818_14620 [Saprospiraceae bacterium]|nr:hypothetical protein [Saprospiraceae bacterium]